MELGGWLVLILVALFSYSRYKLKTTMEVQKKLDLLFWFLFSALWIGIFTQPWSLTTFLSLAPVLGILIGLNFTILSRSTAEFWHFLLVVALLFWQLSPLFSGIR